MPSLHTCPYTTDELREKARHYRRLAENFKPASERERNHEARNANYANTNLGTAQLIEELIWRRCSMGQE